MVTVLPSAFEEMRKASKAELDAFNQIRIYTGKVGLEETIRRAQIKEINNDTYNDTIEDQEGEVYHQISAFTGTFTGISKILKQIRKNINDLTSLFRLMKKDFFLTNEQMIFNQCSVGAMPGYAPIDPYSKYGHYKIATKGSVWPLLVFSGTLKASLTYEEHPDAIATILPRSMRLGTKVEYASTHQYGIRLPIRPPVSFTVGNRFQKWTQFALNFLTSIKKDTFI